MEVDGGVDLHPDLTRGYAQNVKEHSGKGQLRDLSKAMFGVIGAIAIVMIVAETAADIARYGLGDWLDRPISGTDTVLLLAVGLAVVVLAFTYAVAGIFWLLERREDRRGQRRNRRSGTSDRRSGTS